MLLRHATESVHSAGTRPRLVVPEGLLVDEATRDRLTRQFARSSTTIAGIGAQCGALPAGSSYRVHAEWRSLEPFDAVCEAPSRAVRGAVLVAPTVEYAVHGHVVELERGPLLVDAGAHVHDPHAPLDAPGIATPEGRSPFPRRPVVVFLGNAFDARLGTWARRLVNRLIHRDVEARLALPAVPDGLHFTAPLAPCEASIRALDPDAVIALDDDAVRQADAWCAGNRSTVVIQLDRALASETELVSWQVGRASGRLRARIGPRVEAPTLAALVRRLCSGPHPIAPTDRPAPAPAAGGANRRTAPRSSRNDCAVISGNVEGSTRVRLEGLADHMSAAGMTVKSLSVDDVLPSGVADASLVVLSGIARSERIDALVAARRREHRPTIVDVEPRDLAGVHDGVPVLTEDATTLVRMCGLGTSFGGALHVALRALGVRALAVPTLLTRPRAAKLKDARGRFDANDTVIGWTRPSSWGDERSLPGAAVEGLAKVLADWRDARVHATDGGAGVPPLLAGYAVTPGDEQSSDEIGTWTVHLFTPALFGHDVVDDVVSVTEAGHAGVPSVLATPARSALDGFIAPAVVVDDIDDAEQWSTALRAVLENAALRQQLSFDARQRADALNAPSTSKAVVNRLVGWARAEYSR